MSRSVNHTNLVVGRYIFAFVYNFAIFLFDDAFLVVELSSMDIVQDEDWLFDCGWTLFGVMDIKLKVEYLSSPAFSCELLGRCNGPNVLQKLL